MHRKLVTKEAVAIAVSALRAEGRPVSVDTVRLVLSYGSNTTIRKYLKTLGVETTSKAGVAPDMPKTIHLQYEGFMQASWKGACEATAARFDKERREYEARIHNLVVSDTQKKRRIEDMEVELDRLDGECKALSRDKHLLEQTVATQGEALHDAKLLLERSEAEREDLLNRLATQSRLPAKVRNANRHGAHIAVAA